MLERAKGLKGCRMGIESLCRQPLSEAVCSIHAETVNDALRRNPASAPHDLRFRVWSIGLEEVIGSCSA